MPNTLSHPLTRRAFLKLTALAGAAALLLDLPSVARAQSWPESLFVDGHLDLGWNIANFGYDYTRSAYALREQGGYGTMIGLPELLAGQVALVVGVIFVIPARHASSSTQIARYSTLAEAYSWGGTMLALLEELTTRSEQFTLVRTQAELDTVLASWAADQPPEQRQVGIIIGMEGADPITQPDELPDWYARGLRHVGLAWGRTQYAGSSSEPGDLTESGAALLVRMKELGMVLDVAHLSESAFWQCADLWDDPFVYSHGNSRYYLPSERGLSDAQINTIAEHEGLIGIGCYNGFYEQHTAVSGWVTVEDVANALDYVCQLTGDSDHVAIGSDSDGGFGADDSPLDTVADLQQIPALLAARGYQPEDITRITSGNWLRIFRRVLP